MGLDYLRFMPTTFREHSIAAIPARHFCALMLVLMATCCSNAQVSNGLSFGLYRVQLDGLLDKNYPTNSDENNGFGASLGYFVGGSPQRSVGFRTGIQAAFRRLKYDYRSGPDEGTYEATWFSLQVPALLVLRLVPRLRLVAGPAVEVRASGKDHIEAEDTRTGRVYSFDGAFSKNLKPFGTMVMAGLEYRTKRSMTFALMMNYGVSSIQKKDQRQVRGMDLGLLISFDVWTEAWKEAAIPAMGTR